MKLSIRIRAWVFVAGLTWGVAAFGATCTWIADSAANWSSAGNWSGGVPVADSDVVFNGAHLGAATIDVAFTGAVKSVTVNGYTGTITQKRDLSVAQDFDVYSGTWRYTAGTAAELDVTGNMVLSNCTVQCQYTSLADYGTGRRFTVGGNLTVCTNAMISGIGQGFANNSGPGDQDTGSQGGSHGGVGGAWTHSAGGPVGMCYGSVMYPTSLGTGGYTGTGGGAIRLDVGGTVSVDGVIDMEGGVPTGRSGGAGGSVWITADTVTGSGVIRANGAGLDAAGAPGGGGRIAIYYTTAMTFPQGNLSAATTHCSTQRDGAAGTIYIQKASELGTLIVDNNDIPLPGGESMTTLGSMVTDLPNGNVLIQRGGNLRLDSGITLTIKGYCTNAEAFTAHADSTVELAGSGDTVFGGNMTFGNLTCSTAGKTVYFEATKTYTLNNLLTLQGADGNPVILRSTVADSQWKLDLPVLIHVVDYVDAKDSDASLGTSVEALHFTDSGNNDNWLAVNPGQVNTWIGATSTAWATGSNWDRGQPPAAVNPVIISNSCPFYPTLDGGKILLSLEILNGASLNLGGNNLTINSNAVFAGTLTATGSETLTLKGDVDFTSGAFSAASSTMLIAGTTAQELTFAGVTCNQLTLDNDVAQVTVTDAISAASLTEQGASLVANDVVTVTGTLTTDGNATFMGAVSAGALTVGNDVTIQGVVSVTGTLAIDGNATFLSTVSAGFLTHSAGAIAFSDTVMVTGAIESTAGGLVFGGAVVADSLTRNGGNVTFSNNLTVVDLFCACAGDTLTFKDGAVYTVTNLRLAGATGNPLFLRSTTGGSYDLNVSGRYAVTHVDVQDSDATGGLTIKPLLSVDSGDNPNWDFTDTAAWQLWDGSENNNFNTASNWTPALAPTAASWLLVDGNYINAPVVSSTATVARLVVGGYPATLIINARLVVTNDVTVFDNGVLTHSDNGAAPTYTLALRAGDVNIIGSIDVDGRGYPNDLGPGAKTGTSGGGGHGGEGGYWEHVVNGGGTCYGSITNPVTWGSGGDSTDGGGVIELEVDGSLTVSGRITADGATPVSILGSGAGGSILIRADSLEGTGIIQAEGGGGTYGSGGGGRIAIYLTSAEDLGTVSVSAASKPLVSNGQTGASGTIYLKGASATYGALIVDNKTVMTPVGVTTRVTSNVTDAVVGDVVISGTGRLELDANQMITVYGSWSNGNAFVAQIGSSVALSGTNEATVYNNNTFKTLSCLEAGKTVTFEAGKTNTMNEALLLNGPTLRSSIDDSEWFLICGGSATQSVKTVDVKDSNASGGQTIVNSGIPVDSGGNTNWRFDMPPGTVFHIR